MDHIFLLQLSLRVKRQVKSWAPILGVMIQNLSPRTCMLGATSAVQTYLILPPKLTPYGNGTGTGTFSIPHKCKWRCEALLLLEDATHGAITMNMPDCFSY
uniref:AW257883 n=1 Tax=Arundo donax TaxID=35708 RepID=A0A0A9DM27_ARUDO